MGEAGSTIFGEQAMKSQEVKPESMTENTIVGATIKMTTSNQIVSFPSNRNFSVVVPNRYHDIIIPLLESIAKYDPGLDVVIVADGHDRTYGYHIVKYDMKQFSFGRACNLGARIRPQNDIILLNDDCRLIHEKALTRLHEISCANPDVGIISPLIKGTVGTDIQNADRAQSYFRGRDIVRIAQRGQICFPCVLIKRKTINDIGEIAEVYSYGYDDVEYCRRALNGGWNVAVTSSVTVQHGDGIYNPIRGTSWSLSYKRRYGS